ANIGSSGTPITSVTLSQAANITSSTFGVSNVYAGTLNLTSSATNTGEGNIGTSGTPLVIPNSIANISANAAAASYITDNNAGTVTISGPSSAAGVFSLTAPNASSLTNTATIDAGTYAVAGSTVSLTASSTANTGAITLGANIGSSGTPITSVTLSQAANITSSTFGGSTVYAGTLNLTSSATNTGEGNIGTSGTPLVIPNSIANISANAAVASYITDNNTGTVTISGPSSAAGVFSLSAPNASSLTNTATIDAGTYAVAGSTVSLTASSTANTGAITLGANIGSSGTPITSVTLSQAANITSSTFGGSTVYAGTLNLTSSATNTGEGNIGTSGTPLVIPNSIANISANAAVASYITDNNTGTVTISGPSSAAGVFSLTAPNASSLTNTATIDAGTYAVAGSTVSLTASSAANTGAITLGANIGSSGTPITSVTLSQAANITSSTFGVSNVYAGTLNLTSSATNTGEGNIGTSGTPLVIPNSIANISANAAVASYITDNNTGTVTISGPSSAAGVFSLTAPNASSLTNTATIDAGTYAVAGSTVSLTASSTANTGAITLGANIGSSGTPITSVTLSQAANISNSAFGSSNVYAGTLNLTSSGTGTGEGNIGTSGTPLVIPNSIANISANAAVASYITDNNTGTVTISGPSSAAGVFSLTAPNASSLTNTATIDAGTYAVAGSTVSLTASSTANTGAITLGANIGSSGTPITSVTLSQAANITSSTFGGSTVYAGTLNLTSSGTSASEGNIGTSGTPLVIPNSIANISANAAVASYITDNNTGTVTISGPSSAAGVFSLSAPNASSLTNTATIDAGTYAVAGSTVSLTASSAANTGAITLAANIGSSGTPITSVTLSQAANITSSTFGVSNVYAGTLNLTSSGTSASEGNIGTSGTPLVIPNSIANLSANAAVASYITDNNTGTVTISGPSSAAGVFSLTAPNASSLTNTATIDAGTYAVAGSTVSLTASSAANTGAITLGANIGSSGTPITSVTLSQAANITSSTFGVSNVYAGTLNLTSSGTSASEGNIGTSGTPLVIPNSIANLSANAAVASYITDNNTGTVTISG